METLYKIDGYTFRTKLAEICPDYQIVESQEGEVVIYTGLRDDDFSPNYIEMTGEEQ